MSATLSCPNCKATLREEGDGSKQTSYPKPREYRIIDETIRGTIQRIIHCLVCGYEAEPMRFR